MDSRASRAKTAEDARASDSVQAIVVTFHPHAEKLSALLDAVVGQVAAVTIVDNGSVAEHEWLKGAAVARGCELIFLGQNLGVAAAHNRGIARARDRGAAAVLLLDQDSLPAPDMVRSLWRALSTLSAAGNSVGAVGPCHIDERTKEQAPFIRFGHFRNEHLYCDGKQAGGTIPCDHLITSGSLIPISSFDAIGGLDEGLFVDNVDTEWCFRALSKGYKLYGICSAVMSHGVGDALLETWVPFSHDVVIHRPLRVYYIVRNHILLYGRAYTPIRWTLQDLPRLLFKAVVFSTSIRPRLRNLTMIAKGIRDGIRAKTGPYDL